MKIILFDADGVIINKPRLFSEKFSEEYGVPLEKIEEFFIKEWQDCLIGKADTKERIKPYVEKWGWQKSVDEFLEYWFKAEHYVDERIVKSIGDLKSKGIVCCLVTDNDIYRIKYMEEEMGFAKIFDKIFTAGRMGVRKCDREFWEKVHESFDGIPKEEFLVWDDGENNIKVAREFGFQGAVYRSFEDYTSFQSKLG